MRKVKIALFTFIVLALLWAANSSSDSTPKREAGVNRNHTRAVVVTKINQSPLMATAE